MKLSIWAIIDTFHMLHFSMSFILVQEHAICYSFISYMYSYIFAPVWYYWIGCLWSHRADYVVMHVTTQGELCCYACDHAAQIVLLCQWPLRVDCDDMRMTTPGRLLAYDHTGQIHHIEPVITPGELWYWACDHAGRIVYWAYDHADRIVIFSM